MALSDFFSGHHFPFIQNSSSTPIAVNSILLILTLYLLGIKGSNLEGARKEAEVAREGESRRKKEGRRKRHSEYLHAVG